MASEEQGTSLHIGKLDIVTSEFGTGVIFATSTGRGVLCVITDRGVNLGIIRLVMRKASSDLAQKLDLFLASQGGSTTSVMSPGVDAISSDVSALGVSHSADGLNQDDLEAALKELEKF